MFTVLTKYRKTHVQHITEATTVEYFPMLQPDPPPDPSSKIPRSVREDEDYTAHCLGIQVYNQESAGLLLHRPDGELKLNFTPQTSVPPDENLRDVYVMNETGATIAKYVL